MGSAVDWTRVLVALITALPAIIAALYARRVHGQVQTPSGDKLGAVAERAHDLIAADLALTTAVHRTVQNGRSDAEKTANG